MADTKIVCEVCKKEFSGRIPAQQHFESKTHQKAVQNKEVLKGFDTRFVRPQFKCDICDVIMNSDEQQWKHMHSPRHLEKEHKAKTLAGYLNKDAVRVNGISPEQEQIFNRGGKDYDFNGLRGFCYICHIELTSKAVADQHINGEKHGKKKAALQPTPMMQRHVSSYVRDTCNACGERFSDQRDAEAHFAGKKHKEKIASLGHVDMDIEERNPTLSTAMETSYYPTENLAHIPAGTPTGADVRRVGQGTEALCRATTRSDGVYAFDGKTGQCHICNIALTSKENVQEHLTGTRHLKALVKCGADPKVPDSSEYYFNGVRGKCLVCDLDFTSEKHAQDHLSGAKHAKAVQKLAGAPNHRAGGDTREYEMTGTRGYCNVCQLELQSPGHATQHMAGKPHAKARVVWLNRKPPPNQGQGGILSSSSSTIREMPFEIQPTSPGLGAIHHWPSSNQGQRSDPSESSDSSTLLSDEDNIQIKTNENINKNQAYAIPRSTGGNPEDGSHEYWFNGLTGYCNLCSIDLTSQVHTMQHISGKNHTKARQRSQNMTTGSQDVNLFCKICKVPFTGQESAQQHYSSDKHIKREQIKKSHPSVEALGPGPGPTQKVSDNTNWYPCYVCGCNLNSKEQLAIHEQSVSHKAATDGLNSLGFEENLLMNTGGALSEERVVRVTKASFDTGQATDNMLLSTREEFNTGSVTPRNDSVSSGVKFEPIVLDSHGTLDPTSLCQSYTTDRSSEHDETFEKSVYLSDQGDKFPPLNMNRNANNFNSGSLKEKEIHKPSFLSQVSKNSHSSSSGSLRSSRSKSPDSRSTSVGPDSQKHAGSNQSGHSSNVSGQSSLDSGPRSSGSDKMPSLEPIDDIPELVSICISMSELKNKKDLKNTEKKVTNVKLNDVTRKKEGKERQKVEVTTLDHIPVPYTAIDVSDMDSLDDSSSRESTPGCRNRRGPGTDTARVLKNRAARQKTSQELERRVSKESESNDDPDKDTDSRDSSMEGSQSDGNSKSHTQLMSRISQKLKDVTREPTRATPDLSETENAVRKNYKHYCSTCKVPMDTEKALHDHLKGRHHRQKLSKEPAATRQHPPLNKTMRIEIAPDQVSSTKTTPRSYQWELFRKVLAGDRICFLPTGTGKTLIGCMAIGAMLDKNPTYQVLFLVTKVLLVLQQAEYIRNQMANHKYRRFDPNDPSKMVDRELKIAELCGGQQSTGGVPLWQHDIIIATAAYCENMLMSDVLRWQDQCLVIFDEAHHCIKNHSYNNLIATHHYKIPEPYRCKILGLTASPAGKTNYPMTVDMLRQLQINMGDSLIAIVEEQKEKLKAFVSNARIHIAVMETTPAEEQFQRDLKVYLLQCYMRLAAETNIEEHSNLGLTGTSRPVGEGDLQRHAQDLTGDVLDELQALIAMAKPNAPGVGKRMEVQNLIGHINCICMTISVAAEVGTSEALIELQELMATDLNQGFDFARQIRLPCDDILRSIETQQRLQKSNLKSLGVSVNQEMSSNVKCLIKQLIYENYIQWNNVQGQRRPMALVLVKQRATATALLESLKNHPEMVQRNLSVEKIVGHGAAAAERGMSVAQQRKTLEEIKDHKYQVVIATAVAEEGIDIPECELVVSMNPPSTMTALVQMRGRARKLDSHFVIVCNDSKEEAKLSDLLKREENMIKAANFLVQNQNRQAAM